MQNVMKIKRRGLSTFQIIILGFLGVILLGSFALMLPIATRDGEGASFLDALFTSTTSVCVTGLVVQDTGTYWTGFGHAVILMLIQIGGFGVVTVAMALLSVSGKKIGLRERSVLQEAISAPHMSGLVRMIRFILKFVFLVEAIGAVALFTVFGPEFGFWKGLWFSIFHSISAFCNAGIDLLGIKGEYSSLTGYNTNPVINLTIMLLIITGGLGFFTWDDIKQKKFHIRQYRMQSKVILITTAILIIVPSIYFFFLEFQDLPLSSRIWSSLFQSVTPRTAGFNSVDLTLFTETGLVLIIILMLIGGAPGSTAGGMKVTTAAALFSSAAAVFGKKNQTVFFGRRLNEDTIKNASAILLLYMTLFLVGGMAISYMEDVTIVEALFETASAIGTVGLTLGITPSLGPVSHVILILLMFLGRVGGLTLIYATVSDRYNNGSRYPQENLTVG